MPNKSISIVSPFENLNACLEENLRLHGRALEMAADSRLGYADGI